jgi:RND family efflux transporter MFP subunit
MRRFILPIFIIIIASAVIWYIKSNAPVSKQRPAQTAKSVSVDTKKVSAQTLQVTLNSFGQVSAKSTTNISSQVSGRVISISDQLEEGAFFNEGDLLLTIDNKDYQSAINSAKASLTKAQQALVLEQAQVKQAKADWKRLNPKKPVPSLVSRTPQVLSAKADVSAAHAQFNNAILNFQRTNIVAPFNGRVISKDVNIGDFINANTPLANIISTDQLQVRLALKNSDLAFIDLPEQFLKANDSQSTSQADASKSSLPDVTLISDLFSSSSQKTQVWSGKIVRTEATIDQATQQLYVIAEITNPYALEHSDKHPLKIGQYVNASIAGKRIKNATTVNVTNIYQGEYVFIVEDGIIRKRAINIAWQNDTVALINDGLSLGDILITSILSQDSEGSPAMTTAGNTKDNNGQRPRNKDGKQKNKADTVP